MTAAGNRRRFAQAGLSIIELLASILIGMFVLSGAVEVVINTKKEFSHLDEMQFIQNNARFALDSITNDIQMAGYVGCGTNGFIKKVDAFATTHNSFISLHGVRGFEGENNTVTFPVEYRDSALTGTDSLIIRRANPDKSFSVKTHNQQSESFTLWQEHNFTQGSAFVIADVTCRSVGLFQSTMAGGKSQQSIFYQSLAACDNPFCVDLHMDAPVYSSGSKIMEYVSNAYYIAPSTIIPGVPALKRRVSYGSSADFARVEEIANGVEDFEILYGIDSDGDNSVDHFRSATHMDLDGDGVSSDDEWDRVLSIKVSLVFRSKKSVSVQAEEPALVNKSSNDHYLRQVFHSTIRIRNRG